MKKTRKQRKEQRPFSKILSTLLKEKKVSLSQAAKASGVSTSTIHDWANGTAPEDYLAVKRLSEYLNVSFSYLLTGEDESKSHPPTISEVFEQGEDLFDGFAQISIKRLIPKKIEKK